jgi:hypothetical protein
MRNSTSAEAWPAMLAASHAPLVVLSGERVALVVPPAMAAHVDAGRVTRYWDAVATALDDASGLAGPVGRSLLCVDVQCEPGRALAVGAPDVALHPDDMRLVLAAATYGLDAGALRFVLRALACSRLVEVPRALLAAEVERVVTRAATVIHAVTTRG